MERAWRGPTSGGSTSSTWRPATNPSPPNDEHADVSTLAWTPSSDHLLWTGTARGGEDSGGLLPIGDRDEFFNPSALQGIPSPTGRTADDHLVVAQAYGPPGSYVEDLIPDLDGTSSQQLTHDFGGTTDAGGTPWREILGVVLSIMVLLGLLRFFSGRAAAGRRYGREGA